MNYKKIISLILSANLVLPMVSKSLTVHAFENGYAVLNEVSEKVTDTKSDIVSITDNNLKAALNEILGQDANNEITKSQLEGITGFIDLRYRNISNIDGLQYCINIDKLWLSNNKISDIEVLATANFPKLEELRLEKNALDNIDVLETANFPKLKELSLSFNEIEDLSALETANFPKLEVLNLSNNYIEDLSALEKFNFPNLKQLNLSSNYLEDLAGLEKANLSNLQYFALANNFITNLDILEQVNLPNLQYLVLNANAIDNIDGLAKANLPNLYDLSLSKNYIKNIDVLDKINLPKLEFIRLASNYISNINILGKINLGNLEYIDLKNQIISFDRIHINEKNTHIENIITDINGNPVSPQNINAGGEYDKVNNIIKWNELSNGSNFLTYDFDEEFVVNNDNTIIDFSGTVKRYATVKESYKVTYDSQGGSEIPEESIVVEGLITKPTDPVKEGYTFGGWYTNTTYETKWNFETDKMPSQNITLYAKWDANESQVIFAEDLSIQVGSQFDPLINVTAKDETGKDLTEKIKVVENTVDTNKAGIYLVTYEVVDSNGVIHRKSINVKVENAINSNVNNSTNNNNTNNSVNTNNNLNNTTSNNKLPNTGAENVLPLFGGLLLGLGIKISSKKKQK